MLTPRLAGYPRLLRRFTIRRRSSLRGTIVPRDALSIAIVGSRHATQYGVAQAEPLAGSLARAGLSIVSGLAHGVDAAAHGARLPVDEPSRCWGAGWQISIRPSTGNWPTRWPRPDAC